jgi:regulator of protease activity HflC (stomatin/prohibitin superfamily)
VTGWPVTAGLVVLPAAAASVQREVPDRRGPVFRTGRLRERVLRPGAAVLAPFVDRPERVDMSEAAEEVSFTGRTQDGRRTGVEAVLTLRAVDPAAAALSADSCRVVVRQLAAVTLRTEAERRTPSMNWPPRARS